MLKKEQNKHEKPLKNKMSIETYIKYKDDIVFDHYKFLLKEQTFFTTIKIKKFLIVILIANLVQVILLLLLLGKYI